MCCEAAVYVGCTVTRQAGLLLLLKGKSESWIDMLIWLRRCGWIWRRFGAVGGTERENVRKERKRRSVGVRYVVDREGRSETWGEASVALWGLRVHSPSLFTCLSANTWPMWGFVSSLCFTSGLVLLWIFKTLKHKQVVFFVLLFSTEGLKRRNTTNDKP